MMACFLCIGLSLNSPGYGLGWAAGFHIPSGSPKNAEESWRI